jgi:hypothetical protein
LHDTERERGRIEREREREKERERERESLHDKERLTGETERALMADHYFLKMCVPQLIAVIQCRAIGRQMGRAKFAFSGTPVKNYSG